MMGFIDGVAVGRRGGEVLAAQPTISPGYTEMLQDLGVEVCMADGWMHSMNGSTRTGPSWITCCSVARMWRKPIWGR